MDLRVISKGYFKLSEVFQNIKKVSIERDEFEITEIVSQIIEALEELNLEL